MSRDRLPGCSARHVKEYLSEYFHEYFRENLSKHLEEYLGQYIWQCPEKWFVKCPDECFAQHWMRGVYNSFVVVILTAAPARKI